MKPTNEAEAYPLAWPPARPRTLDHRRERADFGYQPAAAQRRERLTIGRARDRLRDELRRLGASGVVVSTNLRLRLDGDVYANQREPDDPGVAVYFTREGRQLAIAIDRWDRVADNLAAVAKSIEAIRGLDRWGGGGMVSAAFSGFKALPGGDALVTPPPMTVEAAAAMVSGVVGSGSAGAANIVASRDTYSTCYRAAAKKLHPDANAGRHLPEWDRLQEAAIVLGRHHGL